MITMMIIIINYIIIIYNVVFVLRKGTKKTVTAQEGQDRVGRW